MVSSDIGKKKELSLENKKKNRKKKIESSEMKSSDMVMLMSPQTRAKHKFKIKLTQFESTWNKKGNEQ